MRNNRTPSAYYLFCLLIGLLFIGSSADAQNVQELEQKMEEAEKFVKEEEAEHKEANDHLNEMVGNFVTLHANLVSLKIPDEVVQNPAKLMVFFTKTVEAVIKANLLTDAMRTMLTNIEKQRDQCNELWADVLLAQTAYEDAIDAFNAAVSPEERVTTVEVPQAPPIAPLYLCPGPCSTPFTTKVLATTSHQVFCQDEPHKASGYSYYSCPPDNPGCPLPSQHTENLDMLACRGPCGKPVPNLSGIPDDSSHRQGCMEKAWFREPIRIRGQDYIRMYVKDCPQGEYYHCKIGLLCPNSDNHVGSSESREDKYVDPQGNVVDPSTVTRDCGHSLSASGDHTKQASCSVTNNRWQRCTVTNFYACQPHTHTYPTVTIRCPRTFLGHTCSKGGYLTIGNNNHRSRCRLGHWYWDCDPASVEQHKVRTCARCSNTYQNCQGNSNPCISGRGHSETADPAAEAPSPPQPNPSPSSETPSTTPPEESDTTENEEEEQEIEEEDTTAAPSTPHPNPSPPSETPPTTPPEESNGNEDEEQETEEEDTTEAPEETAPARPTAVCGSGHTYFTDGSYAVNQHQDRTCLRCSLTYQNCSNHGTACQNRRWHTQDATSYMTGACGHNHRINEKSQHASVTCSTRNANGDTCTGGSYYACQSHTHTYPAPTPAPTPTPTPTPSPPENSNPNNNENEEEEEEEEEEEAPAAPPAPTISYHPCGIHPTTASGVHSLQASCSETNSRGDRCTATSFYKCQHSSHTYPAPPPTPTPTPAPTPTVVCPANSWTNCGGTTSHASTCTGGHTYYTCGTANAWHQDRTCTRCSQTYQNCGNSATACQSSKWHTETPQVVLVACGAASWTGCTSQLTSSTEHQVSCSSGHSYWTCGTATAWHKDRTCSRCRQTYQNCSNSATACQGSRWHRE